MSLDGVIAFSLIFGLQLTLGFVFFVWLAKASNENALMLKKLHADLMLRENRLVMAAIKLERIIKLGGLR